MKTFNFNLLRYFIFASLVLASISLSAQEFSPLETEFFSHQNLLSFQQNKLDSLNHELIQSASLIDLEKSKISPDESKLNEMMSLALTLSKKIESYQKTVVSEEEKVEQIRWQLDRSYHIIIDSLQNAEKQIKNESLKQKTIKQIGLVTEKIILISPPIPSLSFNPKDLLKMTVRDNANPTEKELYRDYLTNAVKEITSHLEYLQLKREEIEEISKLQDKASRFMKDVQSDDKLSIFGQTRTVSTSSRRESVNSNLLSFSDGTSRSSFNTLLRQLDIVPKSGFGYTDYSDFNIRNREFIKLIKEAENRLAQFKQIISDKLVAENANK